MMQPYSPPRSISSSIARRQRTRGNDGRVWQTAPTCLHVYEKGRPRSTQHEGRRRHPRDRYVALASAHHPRIWNHGKQGRTQIDGRPPRRHAVSSSLVRVDIVSSLTRLLPPSSSEMIRYLKPAELSAPAPYPEIIQTVHRLHVNATRPRLSTASSDPSETLPKRGGPPSHTVGDRAFGGRAFRHSKLWTASRHSLVPQRERGTRLNV